MTSATLQQIDVGANAITYDRNGDPDGPTIVLLTGWCQDHRLFDPLLGHLPDCDVLRIDWRGHGTDRRPIPEFGADEQAQDTIAVLNRLGVQRFLPLSTSHGGWANVALAERLGTARVPSILVLDWIMTAPGAEFLSSLDESQRHDRWQQARNGLFEVWLAGSSNPVVKNHLDNEMAAFDYDMWALSCRVIKASYQRWGSPMARMRAIAEPPLARHVYSQPTDPAYERAQVEFGEHNPWFSHRRLHGETHFPTLDSPELAAQEIRAALAKTE